MHVSISDLEIIMEDCNKIFRLWDIENDKIQQIIRELFTKQKTEMNLVLRGPLLHKELETRLLELQKHRVQNDQLSKIINRVPGTLSIEMMLQTASTTTATPAQQVNLGWAFATSISIRP